MSTNDHDIKNKQLSEDEAFIESLYHELAAADSSIDEQPSTATDEKILAAAHRAVTSSPSLVSKKVATKKRIIKKRSWYISLASAASVMLVFSLFLNQVNDPEVQSEMSFIGNLPTAPKPQKAVNGVHYEELYNNTSDESAEQSITEIHQSSQLKASQSKAVMFEQKQEKQKQRKMQQMSLKAHGEKKLQQSNQLETQQNLTSKHLTPDLLTPEVLTVEDNVKTLAANRVAEPEKSNETATFLSAKLMTKEQHSRLLKAKSHWLFVREEKEFYLIQIVNKANEKSFYKLSKKEYFVKQSMQQIIKTRTLKELELLTGN